MTLVCDDTYKLNVTKPAQSNLQILMKLNIEIGNLHFGRNHRKS